jgi:hypothetical protein
MQVVAVLEIRLEAKTFLEALVLAELVLMEI